MVPKRLVKLLTPVLATGMLLSACSATPNQKTDPAAAAGPKDVIIGAIYPLTGSSAIAGTDVKNAITLATEIINGEHPDLDFPQAKWKGLPNLGNAKLKLIVADHQADPIKGKAEAERMITEEKVIALIGSFNSTVTAAVAPTAERYQIPYLNPDSSSPTLTEQGFTYFFRTTPHDGTFVEDAFKFFDDQKKNGILKGDEKLALATENGLWGQDSAKVAKRSAAAKQYTVVEDIAYNAKAANVDAEVQKIKASRADIVMQVSYGPDAILYLQAYKALDYNAKMVWGNSGGFSDAQFIKSLGKDAEYVVAREVWANDLAAKKPIIGQLNAKFKAKYGNDLNGISARALQGMLVLADAINRAKSTDAKAIQAALKATNLTDKEIVMPWPGVKFDEKGQNTLGTSLIVQNQGGKWVTVWPDSVASAKLIYPMPTWKDRK